MAGPLVGRRIKEKLELKVIIASDQCLLIVDEVTQAMLIRNVNIVKGWHSLICTWPILLST